MVSAGFRLPYMGETPLTLTETAEILRLHPETVRRLLQAGELPGVKLGKTWRVSPEALQRFLDDESTKTQAGHREHIQAKVRRTLDSSGDRGRRDQRSDPAQGRTHTRRGAGAVGTAPGKRSATKGAG